MEENFFRDNTSFLFRITRTYTYFFIEKRKAWKIHSVNGTNLFCQDTRDASACRKDHLSCRKYSHSNARDCSFYRCADSLKEERKQCETECTLLSRTYPVFTIYLSCRSRCKSWAFPTRPPRRRSNARRYCDGKGRSTPRTVSVHHNRSSLENRFDRSQVLASFWAPSFSTLCGNRF